MVTIWCKFCLVYIEVKKWSTHIIDKQHKKNLPSKIVVQGNLQEKEFEGLHKYFAKFGKIAKKDVVYNVKGEASVQYLFEDPAVYSVIVHKQHLLDGKLLQVSWCKNSDDGIVKPNIQRPTNSLSTEGSDISMSDVDIEDIPSDFFDELDKADFLNDINETNTETKASQSDYNSKKRSHSRSPSPCTTKKPLLEEILDKLNEINTLKTVIQPVPTPVPPPDPSIVVYNQSFFIGTNPVPKQESPDKLFIQRKISLSDYLTILKNKNEAVAPTSTQAQKKTKILSLCERAIAVMSHKLPKPIKVRPQKPRPKSRSSPLRQAVAKFRFTSPRKESFSSVFHSILRNIGVVGKETDVHKLIESVADSLCGDAVIDNTISAKMLQISLLGVKTKKNKEMKSVRTQCRKSSRSVGVQVDDNDRL